MHKSIAAENAATLMDQNILKWLKTKNLCYKQYIYFLAANSVFIKLRAYSSSLHCFINKMQQESPANAKGMRDSSACMKAHCEQM